MSSYLLNKMSKSKELRHNSYVFALSGALIGIILFLLIYGSAPLLPSNVSFLYNPYDQDMLSHQLGFDFYRNSPWQHPIGQTNAYPYPATSSVINSDSIPILAIFFKLLSPILPDFFQYFGLWLLLCFILQGICASLLMKELKVPLLHAVVCTPFFICNVPLLSRCFHHCALAGQWLILLAFLILLKQKTISTAKRVCYWSLLCGLSILTHGYLFFITGFLMTLGCIYQCIQKKKLLNELLIFFSCLVTFFLCYYEGGGFSVHTDILVDGLGTFTFDPADLINPLFSSYLSPLPIYHTSESTTYLGLGILFLFPFSLLLIIKNRVKIREKCQHHIFPICFLLSSSLLCLLLSMGIHARFAGRTLYDLRPYLNEHLTILLSGLRSTARFIWPLWYLALLLIITTVCRLSKHPRITLLILFACFILQYTDIVPKTAIGGTKEIVSGYDSVLYTSFDHTFSENAKHASILGSNFIVSPAVIAAHHHMTLNASKVGRGPKNFQQMDTDLFNAGELKKDTVYFISLEDMNYPAPNELPKEYRIFYCSEIFVILHESLIVTAPGSEATEIPSDVFPEIIRQFREIYGEPEPIPNYEEI